MPVTRTLRFLIGAALVAGGIQLAGPLALKLAAAGRSAADEAVSGRSAVAPQALTDAGTAPHAPAAPQAVMPPAAIGLEPAASWPEPLDSAVPDSGGGLQWDRSPPPPPTPLPDVPPELAQAAPAFGAAYRSTLRVPPPELLDVAAPPPSGPWSAPASAGQDRGPVPGAAMIPQTGLADLTVPATYRVADGDDLASIAGRFYGRPAAASAIWAANRHAIPDPALLPIGTELRLPPPWAVAVPGRTVGGAIEPTAYARPVAMTSGAPAAQSAAGMAWLPPSPAPPSPPLAAASPPDAGPQFGPTSSAVGATSVRVAPGDTLATLARRLYGDPAAAAEIFAVNRDRLRSPDLLVAGMELRLPRPVAAPRW